LNKLIGAVDIGGTKIAAGVVDAQGRLLHCEETPTAQNYDLNKGLGWIISTLRRSAAAAGGALSGIGVGCTGPVNPLTGILAPNRDRKSVV
jgi:glucokinase